MARPFPRVPDPEVPIEDATKHVIRQYRDMFVDLCRRVPVIGTATFAAATSVAVTLTAPETDTSYSIALLDLPDDNRFWVSGKSTTGFTINAASSSSATIGWALFRN